MINYLMKNLLSLLSFMFLSAVYGNQKLNRITQDIIKINQFDQAIDFFRQDTKEYENYFHHVGIYAFTNKALVRYVSLKRSKLELERKLEQLRALENSMSIHVGYINSSPLSVDTKSDLMEVRKIMETNE